MYPLIPHPHKLLERIENGSGNTKSISTIGEQCSSLVKLGPGKILSKLLCCRHILVPRYDIITFFPWNKNRSVGKNAEEQYYNNCKLTRTVKSLFIFNLSDINN